MTFGSITLGTTIEARKLAEQTEEKERANVFTNFVLSSMFVKPQKTPGDIDNLPADTLIAVVDVAVDSMQIREHFNETSLNFPVHERFFKAYLRLYQELFESLGVAVKPNLVMLPKGFPISFSNMFFEIGKKALISQQITEQFSRLIIHMPVVALKLPAVDISMWTRALDVSNRIIKLAKPVLEVQEAFAKQVQDITSGLDNITRRMSADLAAAALSIRQTISLGVFDNLKQRLQAHDADEAFKASVWTLAPSMSSELIERVVAMHKRGKTQYISRIIMGYYQRNNHQHLIETVESWESHPTFAPRMNNFKYALQAHCQGQYMLSVPALTPQIEGVVNEYVLVNGLVKKLGTIEQMYEAAIGNPDEYGLFNRVIATTLLYLLKTNTYASPKFEDELKKPINRRQVTRHTIAHGVAYEYRPIDSLRDFLILDAISALQEL